MVINSLFIAFQAKARVFFAVCMAGLNERRMQRTKWLVAAACLSLCFPGAVALAGPEALCAGLGSQCICSEPLNTSTHDGGNPIWTPGSFYNPDDSQPPTQCYPYATDPAVEIYCAYPVSMRPASNYTAALPVGHSLSFIYHTEGTGICHVGAPAVGSQYQAPNLTYCLRGYSRWDPASPMPNNDTTNGGQQQKIITIGGDFTDAGHPYGLGIYLNGQVSLDVGGNLHTRFDGNMFNAPVDFQSLGNAVTDCTNNFCRFEICFDYSAIGEGRIRMRRTSIAPGSGQVTVYKPVGNTLQPNGLPPAGYGWTGGSSLTLFAQNFAPIRDNTYFIATKVRPEDRNFWPGPACEVEGGCSGAPPATGIPMAPTAVIMK